MKKWQCESDWFFYESINIQRLINIMKRKFENERWKVRIDDVRPCSLVNWIKMESVLLQFIDLIVC